MRLLTTSLLLVVLSICNAQNVEWNKKNFTVKKKVYKTAFEEFERGEELYHHGKFYYSSAIKHFRTAYKFNPDNAQLNYYIGKCIFGTIHKAESIKYFERAYELDPQVKPDILYQIAQSHHVNEDWEIAMKFYQQHKDDLIAKGKKVHDLNTEIKIMDKHIQECKYGIELEKNPIRVFIDNVGAPINTEYAEFGVVITADNREMYYTSRRPENVGSHISAAHLADDGEKFFYEDIWFSKKNDLGEWTTPENMGKPINSEEHDATIAISPDGQSMLFYASTGGDGGIYESMLDGDEWSKPHRLSKKINTKYHESSAAYSLDKKRIYFVSSKPEDNLGNTDFLNHDEELTHDIFYCDWDDKKERWGDPKNIGSTINTEYNERGVFLHPDGKTLFFSSEGHTSMGGYDIFKSVLNEETGKWSTPENLGYPVNGGDDDIYFVLSADGKVGYYASVHSDGQGSTDIYQITFLGPEKKVITSVEESLLAGAEIKFEEEIATDAVSVIAAHTTILKGLTLDEETKKPVYAKVELIDNVEHKVIATFYSNKTTGKFLVSLPAGKNYGIAVTAEGYLFHSENFVIPETGTSQEIHKDVYLKKVEVDKAIVLKNIFFDTDKSTLRPESKSELERLIKLLNENPTIEIEIGGHTDSRGSDEHNQTLSHNRAKAVVDYLVKHKIAESRLQFKGYGEDSPIASNETEVGRQENRRTEFKITKK